MGCCCSSQEGKTNEELGKPLHTLVDSVDEWPVAAASLAQVHCAQAAVAKGEPPRKLAIKLQYPSLREQMAADFECLRMMASMIQPAGYDFGWIIDDIEKYVTSELDFTREAHNARTAADALARLAPAVLVPPVVSSLTSRRMITTEFVDGLLRFDDARRLQEARLDTRVLGDLVSTAFAELALERGLVHGDPHMGNV